MLKIINKDLDPKIDPDDRLINYLIKKFKVNQDVMNKISIKLAETQEELEAAFRLVYESYLEKGLTSENESKIRITPSQLKPSSTIVIVKYENQVIGTATLIKDDEIPLPVEKFVNLDSVRSNNINTAEISCLAIDKNFRKMNNESIYLLFNYLARLSTRFLDIDVLMIAIHPMHFAFYKAFAGMDRFSDNVFEHHVVNAEAVICSVDISKTGYLFKSRDKGMSEEGDYHTNYSSFCLSEFESYVFPNPGDFRCYNKLMYPNFFKHFTQKSGMLSRIDKTTKSLLEKQIGNYYMSLMHRRMAKFNRYELQSPLLAKISNSILPELIGRELEVVDLSMIGIRLRAKCGEQISAGVSGIELKISHEQFGEIALFCRVAWHDHRNIGFKILSQTENWDLYIKSLETLTPEEYIIKAA